MESIPGNDVRALANFVLSRANATNVKVTNLAINKIVFFLYQEFLLRFGAALTPAKIEAWENGPVFRELYHAFKAFRDQPIQSLAKRYDLEISDWVVCELNFDLWPDDQRAFMVEFTDRLLPIPAWNLRQISHQPGSPWDHVWNSSSRVNTGMQITDAIIVECAKGRSVQ